MALATRNDGRVDLAAELRAELAQHLIPIYQLAAEVNLHPAHLGQVLRGRRPLSPELAERIKRVIWQEGGQDAAA
jgi:hypothetical protein